MYDPNIVFSDPQYAYLAPTASAMCDPNMPEYLRRECFYPNSPTLMPNLQYSFYPTPQFNPLSAPDASKPATSCQSFSNSSAGSVKSDGGRTYISSPVADAQVCDQQGEARGVSHHTVHMIPETLVTGAVNVASSAINTARSVLNMIVPPKEKVSGKAAY